MKPPFLNGNSAPVRLRVPSGKIRNELPSRRAVGRALDGGQALLAIAAFERHEAGEIEGAHEHRQLPQLGLVEDAQTGEQFAQRVEEDRRLDVAGVVDGVDRRAVPLDVLRALDARANAAQQEAEPDADESDLIEERRAAGDQGDEQERRPERGAT